MTMWSRLIVSQQSASYERVATEFLNTLDVWNVLVPALVHNPGQPDNFNREKLRLFNFKVSAGDFGNNYSYFKFGGKSAVQAEQIVADSRSQLRKSLQHVDLDPSEIFKKSEHALAEKIGDIQELKPVLASYRAVLNSNSYGLNVGNIPNAIDDNDFDGEVRSFSKQLEKIDETTNKISEQFNSQCAVIAENLKSSISSS